MLPGGTEGYTCATRITHRQKMASLAVTFAPFTSPCLAGRFSGDVPSRFLQRAGVCAAVKGDGWHGCPCGLVLLQAYRRNLSDEAFVFPVVLCRFSSFGISSNE